MAPGQERWPSRVLDCTSHELADADAAPANSIVSNVRRRSDVIEGRVGVMAVKQNARYYAGVVIGPHTRRQVGNSWTS